MRYRLVDTPSGPDPCLHCVFSIKDGEIYSRCKWNSVIDDQYQLIIDKYGDCTDGAYGLRHYVLDNIVLNTKTKVL